jgi:putative RNA 2'-phosphotransferase
MIYAVIAIAAMTADKFLMELIEKIFIDSKIIPCLIFAAVAVANVGQHYGKPVLFIINTPQMYKHGFEFYQAENGIWLTIHVPTQYLSLIDQTKTGSSV